MPAKSLPKHVLDAWALLALLQKEEPAATRVKSVIDAAQRGQWDEIDAIAYFVPGAASARLGICPWELSTRRAM